jgi:hypothetical protein
MDIVCPVKSQDFDRFEILFHSLERFCEDSFKLYLISPSGESPVKSSKIITIKEEELDSVLAYKKFRNQGWWKQQVIKLLSFKFCDSDYILSLDADCFAVRPFSFDNFLFRQKIRTKISSGGSWDNWYIGSSSLLQLPLHPDWSNNRIGVTPFIFSNVILHGLNNYLKTLYENPSLALLNNTTMENQEVSGATWSEYCLYHVYGYNCGYWDNYHHNLSNFELYGNCLWNTNEAETWDINNSFDNPVFYFSVVQSIAGQSAKWVKDQIKSYV